MRSHAASPLLVLFLLLPFMPVRASALDCNNGNNYSLLKGRFSFRFDAQTPQVVSSPTARNIALRPTSVLGAVIYFGDGRVAVNYNGSVTDAPGKVRALSGLVDRRSGTTTASTQTDGGGVIP